MSPARFAARWNWLVQNRFLGRAEWPSVPTILTRGNNLERIKRNDELAIGILRNGHYAAQNRCVFFWMI